MMLRGAIYILIEMVYADFITILPLKIDFCDIFKVGCIFGKNPIFNMDDGDFKIFARMIGGVRNQVYLEKLS